jgi:hypothetical protein
MSRFAAAIGVICTLFLAGSAANASIVFDDFNVNEGHFTASPGNNGSGTSSIASTSTADRVTVGTFEGAGAEEVVGVFSTATPIERMRFLTSGAGAPASNVAFSVTAGTDGWIGLYAKTSNSTGARLQLAIDEPGNVTTSMVGTRPISLINDGNWHLYEWNLDVASDWSSLSGVTSNTVLTNTTHTIDSIFMTSIAGNFTIDFDYVALNDTGSVADLLPEPASITLLGLAFVAMVGRRSRRRSGNKPNSEQTSREAAHDGCGCRPPPG